MNYEQRDLLGIYKGRHKGGPGPRLMGADTLMGNDVRNDKGEDLGEIKEIMLEMETARVSYAVLSFGGFLGLGDKFFAVPWKAMKLDTDSKCFVLHMDKDRLKSAPGFDKDKWPDMANDSAWVREVDAYWNI